MFNVRRIIASSLVVTVGAVSGCSSASHRSNSPIVSQGEIVISPVTFAAVPRPQSLSTADLHSLFLIKDSPHLQDLQSCDAELFSLRDRTKKKDEVTEGAKELVRLDPIKYHWCFYSKMMQLKDFMITDPPIGQSQDTVVHTYLFLAPIARAFFTEYDDPRYLKEAASEYLKLSTQVFYRNVEVTPSSASRAPASAPASTPVLEKYGLEKARDESILDVDKYTRPPTCDSAAECELKRGYLPSF